MEVVLSLTKRHWCRKVKMERCKGVGEPVSAQSNTPPNQSHVEWRRRRFDVSAEKQTVLPDFLREPPLRVHCSQPAILHSLLLSFSPRSPHFAVTMRSTAVRLLKLKPVPASAIPSLRLPPAASRTKAASAASSGAARTKPTMANVAAELESKLVARQELGSNVRFSEHVTNKELYWKVGCSPQAKSPISARC